MPFAGPRPRPRLAGASGSSPSDAFTEFRSALEEEIGAATTASGAAEATDMGCWASGAWSAVVG